MGPENQLEKGSIWGGKRKKVPSQVNQIEENSLSSDTRIGSPSKGHSCAVPNLFNHPW